MYIEKCMTKFLKIRKYLIEPYRCFNCLFCWPFFLSLASNSPWGLKRTPKSSLSSSYHTFCFSIDTEVVLWRLSLTDSFSRKSCSIVPNFPPTYVRKRLLFDHQIRFAHFLKRLKVRVFLLQWLWSLNSLLRGTILSLVYVRLVPAVPAIEKWL